MSPLQLLLLLLCTLALADHFVPVSISDPAAGRESTSGPSIDDFVVSMCNLPNLANDSEDTETPSLKDHIREHCTVPSDL
jgi:hypothetical protein